MHEEGREQAAYARVGMWSPDAAEQHFHYDLSCFGVFMGAGRHRRREVSHVWLVIEADD